MLFLQSAYYSPLAQFDDVSLNRSLRRQAARLPGAVEDYAAKARLT